jgi:O-antigen/teichoic acid export membrane protein
MTPPLTHQRNRDRSLGRFIAKTAGGTFVLRLFYLASGFITTLMLTRWIGAEGLGVYNFVVSWVVLVAIFVKFGFEDYLVRETAAARGRGDEETASRLWKFARAFTVVSSAVACLVFYGVVAFFEFTNRHLENAFWIGILLIPMLSLIALYRGRFRANKQILNSQVPEYLIRPILLMASIGMLMWLAVPGQPVVALLINVVATFMAMAFCMFASIADWDKATNDEAGTSGANQEAKTRKPPSASDWLLGAFPFVLIAGISIVNQRTDRLMLGAMLDMQAVGFYSVAVQMAMVVNFTLVGLNQAIAPLVAERHDSNRSRELQHSLMRATNLATLGSLAIVVALVLLGPIVLNFFGAEFSSSYLPMIILSVGQLMNVASGPVGTLLSMSRHERFVGVGMATSVVFNLLLNYVLIPKYGVSGAAIATAVSVGIWNLMMVFFAKRILGINANLGALLIPEKQVEN